MATQELGQQPAIAALESDDSGTTSWVDEIPDAHRRPLRRWMWVGAGLTVSTLVVGGITRLTESGLSIVDWAPIVGSIPPLNDADWQEAFARYQQYPEYVKIRPDMTLSEFKQIYFWEYLHRMLGRLIGVAFLIPFILFWIRGYLTGPMFRRVGLLFALGGLQGLMGWYMVSSGLVDRPDVSQYRLAAHLLLAITIFGCCLWFGNDLLDRQRLQLSAESRTFMTRALVVVGALQMIQIFWGALVSVLNAGFILNTFPLMNGSLLPPQGWSHDPVLINLFENLATVQWMHRLLATVLLLSGVALLLIIRRNPALASFQRWGALLAGMIAVQYGLGILTLLSHVRIGLGVSHQLVALAIVGVLLTFLHQIRRSTPEPVIRTSSPRHS
ncbi:MAG: COX15/CtaA family protein [Thermomicrobiales bacterium]|nr:COX15/CtaA family protein [Thermomicrobiales bacterium]